METQLIIITEYCRHSQIDPQFLFSLQEVGLIDLQQQDDEYYICSSQLSDIERYTRWHYELSINAEGIDVVDNLMNRIAEMENEIARLKQQVKLIDLSMY